MLPYAGGSSGPGPNESQPGTGLGLRNSSLPIEDYRSISSSSVGSNSSRSLPYVGHGIPEVTTPAQAYVRSVLAGEPSSCDRTLHFTIERNQSLPRKTEPRTTPSHLDHPGAGRGTSFAQHLYASAVKNMSGTSAPSLGNIPNKSSTSLSTLYNTRSSGRSRSVSNQDMSPLPFLRGPSPEGPESFSASDLYNSSVARHSFASRNSTMLEFSSVHPLSTLSALDTAAFTSRPDGRPQSRGSCNPSQEMIAHSETHISSPSPPPVENQINTQSTVNTIEGTGADVPSVCVTVPRQESEFDSSHVLPSDMSYDAIPTGALVDEPPPAFDDLYPRRNTEISAEIGPAPQTNALPRPVFSDVVASPSPSPPPPTPPQAFASSSTNAETCPQQKAPTYTLIDPDGTSSAGSTSSGASQAISSPASQRLLETQEPPNVEFLTYSMSKMMEKTPLRDIPSLTQQSDSSTGQSSLPLASYLAGVSRQTIYRESFRPGADSSSQGTYQLAHTGFEGDVRQRIQGSKPTSVSESQQGYPGFFHTKDTHTKDESATAQGLSSQPSSSTVHVLGPVPPSYFQEWPQSESIGATEVGSTLTHLSCITAPPPARPPYSDRPHTTSVPPSLQPSCYSINRDVHGPVATSESVMFHSQKPPPQRHSVVANLDPMQRGCYVFPPPPPPPIATQHSHAFQTPQTSSCSQDSAHYQLGNNTEEPALNSNDLARKFAYNALLSYAGPPAYAFHGTTTSQR